jgi:hypothetical protein
MITHCAAPVQGILGDSKARGIRQVIALLDVTHLLTPGLRALAGLHRGESGRVAATRFGTPGRLIDGVFGLRYYTFCDVF